MGYWHSLGFEATLSRLWMPAGSRAMLVVLRLYSSKPSHLLFCFIWTDFCEKPDPCQINNLKCKFLVIFRNMKFLNLFKMLKFDSYSDMHGGSNFFDRMVSGQGNRDNCSAQSVAIYCAPTQNPQNFYQTK